MVERIKAVPSKEVSIQGVGMIERIIYSDSRGFLVETYSQTKDSDPGVYAYSSLVQPGGAKDVDKFHHHQIQTDRFTVVLGKMQVLLYDARDNSPTYGRLEVVELSGGDLTNKEKKSLPTYTLTIPPGVYHGIRNPTEVVAILVNHPTFVYNPQDEGRIPFEDIAIPSLGGKKFSWDLVENEK